MSWRVTQYLSSTTLSAPAELLFITAVAGGSGGGGGGLNAKGGIGLAGDNPIGNALYGAGGSNGGGGGGGGSSGLFNKGGNGGSNGAAGQDATGYGCGGGGGSGNSAGGAGKPGVMFIAWLESAAVGDAMTLTSAYDAAQTAATQSSVNAIPITPLLAASYTAPDNDGIAAIQARLAAQVAEDPVVVIPAPSTALQTVAWTRCYDEHGQPESGITIQIKLTQSSGTGAAWDGAVLEAVSDSEGLATAEIPRGAGLRFSARRGTDGAWVRFGGVDADTLALPALQGAP